MSRRLAFGFLRSPAQGVERCSDESAQNLEALIEALHGTDDIDLTIVGTDEGAGSSLRSLVEHRGLNSRVTFLGPVYGPRLRDLFRNHEIFLLAPSFNEGTSLASLQAAVNGCAPMISEQVGIDGLISGKNGWIVEPTSASVRAGLRDALEAKRSGALIDIRRRSHLLGLAHDIEFVAEEYLSNLRTG